MTSLDFLYWALGAGFLLLVLFLCFALVHLSRILRDVADLTSMTKKTVESVDKNISQIAEKVTTTADQISGYVIKPLGVTQHLFDLFKPVMEHFRDRIIPVDEEEHDGHQEKKDHGKTKRRRFVKK